MRTVWIISEGSPGHVSQSVGLVEALKQKIPLTVQTFECRPQLNGVGRSLVRAWMGRGGRPLPRWVLWRWLHVEPMPGPDAQPDLIVSSGGKSVFAARTLAAQTGVPFVFLGERKPYATEWFHTVLTPSPFETGVNDVSIEMIPTQVTPGSVAAAAAEWAERPAGRLWVMIIGGGSVSHHYTKADWLALAEGMNRIAEQQGIRWLVTTSRRTGAEAEAVLCANLTPSHLAYAIWWAEKPEKKMAAFLGSTETVFVTQDSVTMVTEAVASARPVFVLRPPTVKMDSGSFLPGYFENLERAARIQRMDCQTFSKGEISLSGFSPRQKSVTDELADFLLSRLHWKM